jgi:hypothetical protein
MVTGLYRCAGTSSRCQQAWTCKAPAWHRDKDTGTFPKAPVCTECVENHDGTSVPEWMLHFLLCVLTHSHKDADA